MSMLNHALKMFVQVYIRGGHNELFSKFEYLPGWMPLYNQFQDLFTKKLIYSCPTAIAQLNLKIVKNRKISHCKMNFPI